MGTSTLLNTILNGAKKALTEGEALSDDYIDFEKTNNLIEIPIKADNRFDMNYIFDDLDQVPEEEKNFQFKTMFCLIASAAGLGHKIIFESNKAVYKKKSSKSENAEYVIKEMQHLFQLKGWQTKAVIYDGCNKICLIYLIGDIDDNKNMLIDAIDVYGWSVVKQENNQDCGNNVVSLYFEPIFQDPINNEIKINPVLYHWTPFYRYEA